MIGICKQCGQPCEDPVDVHGFTFCDERCTDNFVHRLSVEIDRYKLMLCDHSVREHNRLWKQRYQEELARDRALSPRSTIIFNEIHRPK